MTNLILNVETFAPNADAEAGSSFVDGTVEATLNGKTLRLKAYRNGDTFAASGFVLRYVTGSKLWPATVRSVVDPRTGKRWESFSGGFESRSGRHHRAPAVWFRDDVAAERMSAR